MGKVFEGNLIGENIKVALVAGRFNEFITGKLVSGAMDALVRHGVEKENIDIAWVPGAFEIPLIAQRAAKGDTYDAVICLGAVIRGATPHFDFVCAEVSKGVAQVSLKEEKPVIFGILTTDSIEQAIERAGTKSGNKGFEAGVAAIEMINLLRNFK